MIRFASLLLACAAPVLAAAAPQATAASQPASSQPAALIASLGQTLAEFYVDPKIARDYRARLDADASAGRFDGLAGEPLGKALKGALDSVQVDFHLSVYAPGHGMFGAEDEQGEAQLPDNPYEAAGWIAPGVAYVRPFAFFGRPQDVQRMQAFVDSHANARALILDLRHHHGGELGEIDVLAADLYGRPTDLARMVSRTKAWERYEPAEDTERLFIAERTDDIVAQTHRAVPRAGGARLAKVPVIVLTSKNTASVAEHLALALKSTGRAVLIGETTMGAGHYGDEVELVEGYKAFVPYGETVDVKTGKGWEGTGIAPDIQAPAKEALNVALARLGQAPVADAYPKI